MKKLIMSDVIKMLAKKTGTTQAESQKFLRAFIELVVEELLKGNSIMLTNFGRFETVLKKETVNNFVEVSGGKKILPAKYYPSFKPAKSLKRKLKEIKVGD